MNELGASFSTGALARVHTLRLGRVPENVDKNRIKDNVILIDNLQGRTIEEYTNDEMKPYIEAFNKKQKQKCRRIKTDYIEWHKNNGQLMQHVKNKEDVKFAYETVICYGNHEDLWHEYFNPLTSEKRRNELYEEGVRFYKEAVEEFQEKYPHLKIVYAVIHADEPNGSIHCHLCFQPQAEYNIGLPRKICIGRALSQDGIERLDERKDADIEGYQLTRLYKEFRHQVLNRKIEELGYEIKEEEHGKQHIETNDYKEKMKKLDERKKKIEKAELFVDTSKMIEEEEKKIIKNDSEQIKFIPEKKNIVGKVVQEEQVVMPRSVYDSKMAFVNIQREKEEAERIAKKQNKHFKEAVESILTTSDIETKKENERLKEQVEEQNIEINELKRDLTKARTKINNLNYTIEKVKEFVKSLGLTERFINFMKQFQEPERERSR